MPTQVRIFTMPRPLGETLASPSQTPASPTAAAVPVSAATPRSIPEYPEIPKPTTSPGLKAHSYSMSSFDDNLANGVTFASQEKLPKLPIPDLKDTCQRYLTALKPLQSPREHAETNQAVLEFLKGDGPELNEKLKKYAEGRTSYIEQFWYDSYLNFDNPVVLNLNPFFLLEDDPTPARNNQVTRAASLVASALEFVRAVRKEELPPDTVRGTPLDMYQYSRLFGTARVPTDEGCQIEQDPDSRHIIVMCHGQFYWFDVLDDNSDVIMTERDIAINLQTIVDDATQTPIQEAAKGALGVLSTENRKTWSGLRDVLTREHGSNNADCLGIVDSALFVVCLDYSEPATAAALCQNMLCGTSEIEKGVQIGTCTNRWYDKLQIIVCKNGSAGINFEHTGVDGHTVLRFASDIYTDTILRFARTINGKAPTMWTSTSPDPSKRDPESFGDVNTIPYKLEWDMIPELKIAVRFAETRLADLIEQNEFECLDFGSYGKNFITSMGFSPDAFVQMAFQAAYYGLYGRVECTYEPAMTKMYLHGRTEAIRTVTDESVAFVQTFWADHPAEQKVEALRKACQRHVNTTRECAKAQGCDRHLYALFCLWQRMLDQEQEREGSVSSGSQSGGYSSPVDGSVSPVLGYGTGSPVVGSPLASGRDAGGFLPGSTMGGVDGVAAAAGELLKGRERGDSTNSRSSKGSRNGGRDRNHSLPLIFADSGWDKLNTTILSTSNCGNPSLRHFGFGPVSGDGFGIGYIIKDEAISICVSSRHRQTRRFVDTLESYLLEIRRVLRITSRKVASVRQTRAREIDHSKVGGGKVGAVGGHHGHGHGGAEKEKSRLRLRGRLITGHEVIKSQRSLGGSGSSVSPTEESMTMSEDDELGGYGFFDAGMLLQALKARGETLENGEATKPSERAVVQSRRRGDVGKKLRLVDY
ncbi:Choline/Carnitine o-acyltransferase-domain-containing protein [Bombardia bombarda]|uniref:Choline/Carnitine o-acyltransferase-domain-containing protein n=1 Tax=Bombardia bombarda TaxID=252184 RepID=A0AA40BW09_9PEZI|nr:Choline/Carnitine o-acyltransferase-domain-containing protein [Bombardia bombarda]